MKLVVYFTRDGHTETVGKTIAEVKKADLRKIHEAANRKGFIGYMKAGYDSMIGKTKLNNPDFDVSRYDTIYFGAPVWGWRPAPAILEFMKNCDLKGKKIVNFVTMGGQKGKSFQMMNRIVKDKGGTVLDNFAIATSRVSDEELVEKAKEKVTH